ncbi:transmembrane protein, putative (macronuclear) [Tetrahymena thermophila SB210]|uniref:Transmembrane protein, putative n=1 Tax=Tetrahymena thermophila (strain SB210) TaxID=312017 RepID=W7XL54_TETTS|nr:transmembrane protein, putative [Tetrahymena thermophila SB210]EWS75694.1 transmembrane protein, putative [Tetrahymena thermophila SB210]|eukprot:XP_012651767.1 transmembrane protein, putative [Tetrahymena thermophila SB210]
MKYVLKTVLKEHFLIIKIKLVYIATANIVIAKNVLKRNVCLVQIICLYWKTLNNVFPVVHLIIQIHHQFLILLNLTKQIKKFVRSVLIPAVILVIQKILVNVQVALKSWKTLHQFIYIIRIAQKIVIFM